MKLPSQKAFTLIEIMIVVAIIGILAAIAIPAFQTSIEKAQARSEIHEVIADDPHAPGFQRRRDRVWIKQAKKLARQLG